MEMTFYTGVAYTHDMYYGEQNFLTAYTSFDFYETLGTIQSKAALWIHKYGLNDQKKMVEIVVFKQKYPQDEAIELWNAYINAEEKTWDIWNEMGESKLD